MTSFYSKCPPAPTKHKIQYFDYNVQSWASINSTDQVDKFVQLVVLPGVCLNDVGGSDSLANLFSMSMGVRIRYEAEVEMVGGQRRDLFFYVHADDCETFAKTFKRQLGAIWWEDVWHNSTQQISEYPVDFIEEHPPTW